MKGFNFAEARDKAIRVAHQELEQGLEQITEKPTTEQGGGAQQSEQGGAYTVRPTAEPPVAPVKDEKPAEPTKGVQTYIPMSQYRRLNDIKLTRRENIAVLAAQAIDLWLDVQDGKMVVTKVDA